MVTQWQKKVQNFASSNQLLCLKCNTDCGNSNEFRLDTDYIELIKHHKLKNTSISNYLLYIHISI